MSKYSVEVGPKIESTLNYLTESHEATKAEIFRKAITLLAELTEQVARGNRLQIISPDGEITALLSR